MTFHRPKLTRAQARRALWLILGLAILTEAGICLHCFHARDAVTGTLVVTAWGREYILQLIEHIGSELA